MTKPSKRRRRRQGVEAGTLVHYDRSGFALETNFSLKRAEHSAAAAAAAALPPPARGAARRSRAGRGDTHHRSHSFAAVRYTTAPRSMLHSCAGSLQRRADGQRPAPRSASRAAAVALSQSEVSSSLSICTTRCCSLCSLLACAGLALRRRRAVRVLARRFAQPLCSAARFATHSCSPLVSVSEPLWRAGGDDALALLRASSLASLASARLPTSRDEAFRMTDLSPLTQARSVALLSRTRL